MSRTAFASQALLLPHRLSTGSSSLWLVSNETSCPYEKIERATLLRLNRGSKINALGNKQLLKASVWVFVENVICSKRNSYNAKHRWREKCFNASKQLCRCTASSSVSWQAWAYIWHSGCYHNGRVMVALLSSTLKLSKALLEEIDWLEVALLL